MPVMQRRTAGVLGSFAADVHDGLTRPGQKELPSKYLYDALGSALFEAICELPEYGLTRAEDRLLRRHADEMVSRQPGPSVVAELGCGSGRKTRTLVEAFASRGPFTYAPIDVSPTALAACQMALSDLASVRVLGIAGEYLDGLAEACVRRPSGGHLAVLFLGSTLGNFDRPAALSFLRQIRRVLLPGDTLLLGADLEKPVPALLAAYDDSLGVTAAFNRNLLVRLNRELDAGCDPRLFHHLAVYREDERRIEMHLQASRELRLTIPRAGVDVSLGRGETLWTESCHKFNPAELDRLGARAGFRCDAQWIDREWPFADCLWVAA
jgi:L-histidine N-alpha-methyltransferase